MAQVLTVATRAGSLAIAQTELVTAALRTIHPALKVQIKQITTSGDRDRRTALWDLKTTGFFTSQLEDALLAGHADFAVHSYKDLPTQERDGLTVTAVCLREFAQDCLIAARPLNSIDEIPASAKIGTSSLRRIAQIKRLRPDVVTLPIRGNVPTRIRKLEQGQFDAVILARAGIERLGLAAKVSFCFDPQQFIPAPAQGALAVQTRADDSSTNELVAAIDDRNTRTTTSAERCVLASMRCGCHAPAGAFATIAGDSITIDAFVSDLQGRNFIRRQITGPATDADALAERLANDLLTAGARKVLSELKK